MHSGQVFLSCACLLILAGLYVLVAGTIPRLHIHPKQRRRAKIALRYALGIVFAITLIVVWAEEIRSGALVLSAFAVALVLASKELLMCLGGWWIKLVGGHFRLGDRIRVGDYTGDVIDYGLLTTTLVETAGDDTSSGHSEGALLTVPNSVLLHSTVRNETRFPAFRTHDIAVRLPEGALWQDSEGFLQSAANEAWAPIRGVLEKRAHGALEDREIPPSFREPRVLVSLDDGDRVVLTIRVCAPTDAIEQLEDQVLRAWLSRPRA
jgi:small-conductance mechanosensitive channel